MSQTEQSNDISLPLHKHLRLWLIHTIMYVEHVTNQLEFLPAQPGFCMLAGAWQDFSSQRFFHKPWLSKFFSSWRFYFSASQPDPPIVGVSDIGHGLHWPETGTQAWDSNLGTVKWSTCKIRGLNPVPTKHCAHDAHKKYMDHTQIVHKNTSSVHRLRTWNKSYRARKTHQIMHVNTSDCACITHEKYRSRTSFHLEREGGMTDNVQNVRR